MTKDEILERLKNLDDSSVDEYIEKLKRDYGKYALPIREARQIIDEAMGDVKLTDVLFEMREESL